MKFVVVLTFLAVGQPQQVTVHCPDPACAEKIMERANELPTLSRLRAWEADEFAPASTGTITMYAWPPFVDRWYQ